MLRLLIVTLVACSILADIIDRIEVIAGSQVITELQIEEELRVTAFLNQSPIRNDIEQRRAAATRLVQQALVAHEMQLSHYPAPSDAVVQEALERLETTYGNNKAFEDAESRYEVTTAVLERHLALQIAAVQFIGLRFRPEFGVSDADLQSEYRRQVAIWQAQHPNSPVPSFDKSRASIRSALIEQRTDEALTQWLRETRNQIRIAYVDKSLEESAP